MFIYIKVKILKAENLKADFSWEHLHTYIYMNALKFPSILIRNITGEKLDRDILSPVKHI